MANLATVGQASLALARTADASTARKPGIVGDVIARHTQGSFAGVSLSEAIRAPSLRSRRPLLAVNRQVAAIAVGSSHAAHTTKHGPRKVAIFVEPSPFTYVCGYKNRFCNLIRYLREAGDEVLVVTSGHNNPVEYHGAKVVTAPSFSFPFYPSLYLSLGVSPTVYKAIRDFKPDIIHASSPGFMVFAALVYAKLLSSPLVLSYHTHVPQYIPRYTFKWLVYPMWAILRFLHQAANLTLVTSTQMRDELRKEDAAHTIKVWRRGVDSDIFHPRFRSPAMRARLCGGDPSKPLVVHVGRLGAEKNLTALKTIMANIPDGRLAFVGDGPERAALEEHFKGTPTVFTGMLHDEELSQAFASGDVFVMPSETETLGFVVLEAMASGVPVVAVRAGGIPDIVTEDGKNGLMYSPGDYDQASWLVKRLLEDAAFRKQIADNGRAEVERWDWRAATTHLREKQYPLAVQHHAQGTTATISSA